MGGETLAETGRLLLGWIALIIKSGAIFNQAWRNWICACFPRDATNYHQLLRLSFVAVQITTADGIHERYGTNMPHRSEQKKCQSSLGMQVAFPKLFLGWLFWGQFCISWNARHLYWLTKCSTTGVIVFIRTGRSYCYYEREGVSEFHSGEVFVSPKNFINYHSKWQKPMNFFGSRIILYNVLSSSEVGRK